MPDRDLIRAGVSLRFKRAYNLVLEGHYGDADIASIALRCLRDELKVLGNGPIAVIAQVADQLKQLPDEPLFRETIDWEKERQKIDDIVQKSSVSRYGLELARRACHRQLVEMQYQRAAASKEELLAKYISSVYAASFADSVPLVNGVNPHEMTQRLQRMEQHIRPGILGFARSIAHRDNLSNLRRPRREKRQIDLNTDLLRRL